RRGEVQSGTGNPRGPAFMGGYPGDEPPRNLPRAVSLGPFPKGTRESLSNRPRTATRVRAPSHPGTIRSLRDRSPNLRRDGLELLPRGGPAVIWAHTNPESVPVEPRDDVHVDVEHLLSRVLAVRQPQVHRITSQSAA